MTKFRDQQGRIHRLGEGGRTRHTSTSITQRQFLPESQMTLDDLERLREDIEQIIGEIQESPALKGLQEVIDLIGLNAETIIENILREMELAGISRDHGDKISKVESGLTLLSEHNQVIAEQFVELFARMDTTDASMQAQYQQIAQAIADEVSARAEALASLHAQIVEEGEITKAATNARIDTVKADAASALASTRQTLITQFTEADDALNTALSDKITAVETSAEEARVEQQELILAQVNDSIGVVQQQVNTKVNTEQAQSIASTQVEAFKGTHFATLQQQYEVQAGKIAGMDAAWSATYTLKINAGTIGGKPVVAGIGMSAVDGQGSDIIFMANRVAIVQPNYNGSTTQLKYPFVVGTVGGVSTVGITGQLLVDGSITANKITTNTLSAITANAGTINGGTFKTHTLDAQGQVVNPLEFRAEMSNLGNWPLWIGTGVKSSDNAVMWIDRQGNAMFKGKINAQNIVGALQREQIINWSGYIMIYNLNGHKPIGQTITTFTLPAPVQPGEVHIPCITLTVGFNCNAGGVSLWVDEYRNGAWFPCIERPFSYVRVTAGPQRYPPVYEKSITIMGFGTSTAGARQFRLRAMSNAFGFNPPHYTTDLSVYVTTVKGTVFGIR